MAMLFVLRHGLECVACQQGLLLAALRPCRAGAYWTSYVCCQVEGKLNTQAARSKQDFSWFLPSQGSLFRRNKPNWFVESDRLGHVPELFVGAESI